jgi:hypothetical protein
LFPAAPGIAGGTFRKERRIRYLVEPFAGFVPAYRDFINLDKEAIFQSPAKPGQLLDNPFQIFSANHGNLSLLRIIFRAYPAE